MISLILCESVPDHDPAPYIPTFYQFSDDIEHCIASDVSHAYKISAKCHKMLFAGSTDAATFNSPVLSHHSGQCV